MNQTKLDNRKEHGPFLLDAAALLDLRLPEECKVGVEVNIELMRIHARKVDAFKFSDLSGEAIQA